MATGRTEEEERGSRKANGQHRRNRRQGRTGSREKKDGRLSSQNRGSADERKRSKGKARKRSGRAETEKKGSTGKAAVGAKPGRMKGNLQKAEYEETEAKHGKPGGAEVEKQGSRKAERQHRRSRCETETGRDRKGRNRG